MVLRREINSNCYGHPFPSSTITQIKLEKELPGEAVWREKVYIFFMIHVHSQHHPGPRKHRTIIRSPSQVHIRLEIIEKMEHVVFVGSVIALGIFHLIVGMGNL